MSNLAQNLARPHQYCNGNRCYIYNCVLNVARFEIHDNVDPRMSCHLFSPTEPKLITIDTNVHVWFKRITKCSGVV
jgi:hypothetical protein